jgi:hypothetical protein
LWPGETFGVSNVIFCKEIPSTMDAVGDTIASALDVLRKKDWIAEAGEFNARLCLEEALVNAVTHGNKSNADLTVRIEMEEEAESGCCVIRVQDQGNGFRADDVTLPDCDQADGRGICLIRYFMDDVTYDPATHSLVMKMRRPGMEEGACGH